MDGEEGLEVVEEFYSDDQQQPKSNETNAFDIQQELKGAVTALN